MSNPWGDLFTAFTAGTKNSDDIASFMSKFDAGTLTTFFKGIPTDNLDILFKKLDASKISGAFEKMSDAELDKLFKRIPDDAFTQLTSTLKQSDKAKLFAKLNNVDPTFAKKLAPNVDNLGDTAAILKNPPPSGATKTGVDGPLNNLNNNKVFTRSDAFSKSDAAKYFKNKKLELPTKPMKGGEGYFEKMKNWFRNIGKKQDEILDGTDMSKGKKEMDEIANSKLGKESLLKLGLYGAGGIAILMMIYDTPNPFKAIMEALKDIQETVEDLKEIVDAAGKAAKNTAKGGFDLIAWLGENWWMPAVVCLVFLIIFLISSFM